jgi:hypothetical protein
MAGDWPAPIDELASTDSGCTDWGAMDCRIVDAVMNVRDARLRSRLARFAARHTPEERPRRKSRLIDRKSLAAGDVNEHGGLELESRDL